MTLCEDITDGEDNGKTPAAGLILTKGEFHLQMTVTETDETGSSTLITTKTQYTVNATKVMATRFAKNTVVSSR